MNYAVKGIGLVAIVIILFWALQTEHHWTAIAILLAIIFYALFANPMKHVQVGMSAHAASNARRSAARKKKKKK